MFYVCIDHLSDDKLGFLGYTMITEDERFKLYRDYTGDEHIVDKQGLPIRLTPMTATCRVLPLSRVKLGIGWSRGVARDAEQ